MLWRMPEMVAPRALVFRPLVKGNEALGTKLPFGAKYAQMYICPRALSVRSKFEETVSHLKFIIRGDVLN